jgi:hypothetical protein
MQVLHEQVRIQAKKPKWTQLMIIDSQTVKNTYQASVETKGFCFYKATNGIKRHLAVNTLGFRPSNGGINDRFTSAKSPLFRAKMLRLWARNLKSIF